MGRSGRRRRGSVVALLIVCLFVTMIRSALSDDRDHGPGPAGQGGDHIVSAPREGRDTAILELQSGATAVNIRVTPDDVLLRASTPDGAKQLPVVSLVGDRVQLQLVDSGVNGASAVDVALSDAVRWQIRLVAGSTDTTMDLAGGRVRDRVHRRG